MIYRHRKLLALPLLLAAGCVYSHRPVVYEPATGAAVVTVSPASDRNVIRVYPEPATTPAAIVDTSPTLVETRRATAAEADLNIANTIRAMLENDSALASAAINVRISVLNSQIALTGRVLTEHDRELLHTALVSMPGVTGLDDHVQVEFNH